MNNDTYTYMSRAQGLGRYNNQSLRAGILAADKTAASGVYRSHICTLDTKSTPVRIRTTQLPNECFRESLHQSRSVCPRAYLTYHL